MLFKGSCTFRIFGKSWYFGPTPRPTPPQGRLEHSKLKQNQFSFYILSYLKHLTFSRKFQKQCFAMFMDNSEVNYVLGILGNKLALIKTPPPLLVGLKSQLFPKIRNMLLPKRFILKTCGTTTPLDCIKELTRSRSFYSNSNCLAAFTLEILRYLISHSNLQIEKYSNSLLRLFP